MHSHQLQHLPKPVIEHLQALPPSSQVVFELNSDYELIFKYVNDVFITLHKQIGIQVNSESLKESELTQYFREVLGFTEVEIKGRMDAAHKALDTNQPFRAKEISTLSKDEPLVLETMWTPIVTEGKTYLVWSSKIWER